MSTNPEPDGKSTGAEMLSPAVRRLAAEHNVDLSTLTGSGEKGRITRDDVLRAGGAASASSDQATPELKEDPQATPSEDKDPATVSTPEAPVEHDLTEQLNLPAEDPAPENGSPRVEEQGETTEIAMTKFEKKVAASVLQSASAPRMTTVFEVEIGLSQQEDRTQLARAVAAAAEGMLAVPEFNARFKENQLEVFSDVNVGIGLFVDGIGVVVPIIKRVQDLSLAQIEDAVRDKTKRSMDGKLQSDELNGGTFTIYHPAHEQALFSLPPTVYEPQVAALSLGCAQRRPVVVGAGERESLQIRSMAYFTLNIDYRVLDWRQADVWIAAFRAAFERPAQDSPDSNSTSDSAK